MLCSHRDLATKYKSPEWDFTSTETWMGSTSFAFQVLKVNEKSDKFEVTVDVSQFKPEELKVTTNNNILSIEGKHEEAQSDPNNSSSVMRQFSRKWTLPEGCKAEEVVSNLSSDGILMVTAPKKPALGQDAAKAIK